MAYRSSLNVSSINKSLSGLNKSLLAARESAKNVNATIVQSTREKRKSFSANIKAFNQRREAVRRKEREDIVEASTVKGAISRSRTSVASSTRGFLGRIMDFLGTLLVGWAITNLPNIIKMAQSLMKRMQTYFGFLNQFKDGLQDFLISFGSMVGGVASSLGNFDFIAMKKLIDKGMGKMKDSFVQMSNSLNNVIITLKQDINKLLGLDLFDIPGSDGDDGGDDSGDGNPPVSGSGPAGTAYGVDLNRLATATGAAEGTYNSVGVTVRGGGHGLGRYQFMTYRTDTTAVILKNAKAMGEEAAAQRLLDRANGNDRDAARQLLKYFPPKDQDALFKNHATNLLTQIKKKYPNASVEFLVKRFAAGHISGNFEDLTTPDIHGTTGKMHGDKIWREYQKAKPSPPPPAKAQKVSNFTMNNASKPGAYAGGDPEKSPKIGDVISSNTSQKSTLLASNLQQTRQRPGTNTLLYNNEVIKTVYMPSNSYGGDVIVLAGGVNSGRRNRFLNSLA